MSIPISSAGTIAASGGILDLTGTVSGRSLAIATVARSVLKIDGTATSGAIAISNANQTLEIGSSGGLTISAAESITNGKIQLDGGTLTDASGLTIGSGATLTGSGTVVAPVDGAGAVTASGGTLEFTGTIDSTTASAFHIANAANSVLKFDGVVGTASIHPTITFDGGLGVLDLTSDALSNFHATIANFASGEGIKVTGAAAAVLNFSGTFITVYNAAHNSLGSINLSTSYVGDDFVVSGGTISVEVDTTTPTGRTPDLLAASDSGVSNTDNITSVTGPTFIVALNGTVAVGDTVQLLLNGSPLSHPVTHTITFADLDAGSVNLTVTAGDLGADGSKSISAKLIDLAGHVSTTSALSITLDTTAPTGGTPDLIAASDTGSSDTDNLTRQTAPTFQVALDPAVQAGDTVELKLGGGSLTHPVLHTITAGDVAAGSVQLTVTAGDLGADGTKSFTAVFADTAGNTSTTSALSITLDTTAPTGGTPDLIAASDTGSSNTDNLTRQTAPTFQVALDPTVQAGDTVELKLGGGSLTHPVLHTITAGDVAAGSIQLTVTAGDLGADGAKVFTAVFADTAGNTSTTSALSVALDTTAPTGGTPDLIAASDTGSSGVDNLHQADGADVPGGARSNRASGRYGRVEARWRIAGAPGAACDHGRRRRGRVSSVDGDGRRSGCRWHEVIHRGLCGYRREYIDHQRLVDSRSTPRRRPAARPI